MLKWLDNPSRLRVLVCWLALIAAWEAGYRVVGWKDYVFPAPSHVLDSTLEMLGLRTYFGDELRQGWPLRPANEQAPVAGKTRPSFWNTPLVVAVRVSLYRLVLGFLISVALGLALGLLMWRYKFIDAMLGPVFLGLQTLPSVCWVPLAVLAVGMNETGILFVLVMGSFFAIAITLRDGLHATPPIYRAAGRVFGARRLNFYIYVMLPAGLPALASSLRSGFSFAWRSLMGAELILMLQRHGLGHLLHVGREYGGVEQVVAVMIVMVIIGMAFDRFAFARIERRVRVRFGLAG